jgi:hypothetical protein
MDNRGNKQASYIRNVIFMLINKKKFDYTKWRKGLFEKQSIEELSKQAMNYVDNS